MIEIKVHGTPVAQGRPRFFRRGNFVGVYDPEKSKSWKETVKWQAIQQNKKYFNEALTMHLEFYLPRPMSLPKKVIYPIKRPDIDNLIKGVKDALKGICYRDDSQIISLSANKNYGIDFIGVIIRIEKL
jgi:Holliday junction resolvase RusA-like endonuclease